MSEVAYLPSSDCLAGPETSTLEETASEPGIGQIVCSRESGRGREIGKDGAGSAQAPAVGADSQILESLKKVRDRALASRRRAIADAFALADQCKAFAQHLPKAQLIAFIRAECLVSRTEANAYLLLANFAGPERADIKQSAIDVSVLCRLAKQPPTVRDEALTMLRSGRSLSLADLRLLRRDVLAAEAAVSGKPDRSAVTELKSAVRLKAQEFIDRFLEGLGGLANAFADLYNETNPEDRSPETVARVDALAASAGRLSAQLQRLVPVDFLASGDEWPQHSWSRVFQTLNLLADRKLCSIEDWSWPEVDPLWIDEGRHEPLMWALGQELPELSRHRRRLGQGVVALDRHPQNSRSRPAKPYRYSVLELCAGAGGQAIGLHAAGFWHAGIFEKAPEAAATLRANRPKWPVFEADINKIDVSRYRGVDLVAGGLPCQPYSQAGERRGAEDERDLFDRALEIIEQVQPKAVLIENVVGISQVTHGVRRLQVYAELERMGYDAEWRIIEGPDFGLAQNRRRAILVALRRGMLHRFRWPLAPEMAQTSVGSRLKDLMGARGWRRLDQWVAKANGLAPTLIGGSTKKMGIDLAQPNSRQAWFNIAVDPRKPAKEAPDPDFDGIPCLTLPMLARLQDFPDDWVFSGSRQAQFRQMANAFPPRLSRVLGLALQRALSGEEIDLGTAIEAPLFKRLDLAEFNRQMREAAE
ncbi:DNA (cytosine-5-)-methyltransferase [Bosea sp. AS-1]|uniref:DNA cytosine methyltransferase n=1 Tax=Bosea sp. AS-1 TaxID=2015316 RepID=UPI000B7811E0|nr:DNA (cytosine-5-)-methyltransferase [Bosea sp. AS-1]